MPFHSRHRPGFTLTEVMIAMTLMLFILSVATNSFRKQSGLIAAQSGRLEAQQTVQFTLSELDRELRLAGVGVADMQPIVIQADSLSVTFNADLVSTVPNDPSAVYYDAYANPEMTTVWRSAEKRTLPRSGFYYPDSTHMRSVGAPSGAETISYWLARDSSVSATNEYVLFRRVNHGAARLVAKGIIRNPTDTVFQFFKGDSVGNLTAIPAPNLPIYHNASTHGVKADTGRFAWVDSIRTIRVRMTVVFRDRSGPVYRRLDHTIRLMNAGLVRRSTCGEPPIGTTPSAVAALDTAGVPVVTITFPQSSDEGGGERDVERYALYRRLNGETATNAEPFASIPAGNASYVFTDSDVASGQEWVYGVASQDCTPQISGVSYSASVTIP